jgi:GMC oxidoreductase
VCNEFEHGPKGDGYGARIECPSAHPGLLASALVWRDPQSFKDQMRQVRNAVPLVVLQRDTSEGTVRLARDGRTLVIDYDLNEQDRQSMGQALTGGLQVLMTSGAKYVSSSHVRDPGLVLDDQGPHSLFKMASNERIQNYLSLVSSLGVRNHQIGLFSAHQMGTCRMSASPLLGAVDANGEAWDCDNLYVMDASLFPTASGVNPMVTVMALAKMLSSRLATRLRYQDRRPMGTFEAVRAQELLASRQEVRTQQHPSYSQHRRMDLSRVRLPSAKVVVPLLFGIAALLLAISLVGLIAVKLRQASSPPPPAPVVEESWVENLAKKVGDIQMPGLIPTSVMWTLLLFPFF